MADQKQPARNVDITLNEPPLYINGFTLGSSATEVVLFLMNSAATVGAVQMPPSVAKDLGQKLLELVENYEKSTGQKVPSLAELVAAVSKAQT